MLISNHNILSLPSNPSAPFNTVGADPHSCEQSVFQHNCSQRYSSVRAAAHSSELFLHSDSAVLETPGKHGLPYWGTVQIQCPQCVPSPFVWVSQCPQPVCADP